MKVLVFDLQLEAAERTVEMIEAEGGTAVAHVADATSEAECKRLVDAAVERFGRLDFLDNNVGIGSRGSVVDEKPETIAASCRSMSRPCSCSPSTRSRR